MKIVFYSMTAGLMNIGGLMFQCGGLSLIACTNLFRHMEIGSTMMVWGNGEGSLDL
ncbi:predicted protein [Pyrenophora tritici-repentis Pt-1C-BFP]|uniref:Uncharacterized protein n=1 Tax=Pyrenophora tritici-repentis (strain Pt-1C-BFP) TaxID=426418 RepID=B2W399_PYRTR|nr:uncharacterized protein PTRG_04949 [Pyrenophora tritici-repentis Pt-1C-BFP]EDU47856.1 predicted protein [Pyrenophora tritici-repentis Pt-1C-BFP]